ncbi:hypothetical protein P7H17_18400 [Paenibacillus larvae]|nr:hypothetical protein [Paenibacillus larvae]MDT2287635.1 hypothetical protein [Paenibacillus larvae]
MIELIKKKMRGGEKPYPRSYDEAKNRIKRQLEEIQGHIKEIPEENRMDEIVLTLRLNEDFLAKHTFRTHFSKRQDLKILPRRWVFEKDSKNEIQ